MIFKALITITINILSSILTPFSFVGGFVYNIFEITGIVSAIDILTLYIGKIPVVFFISSFLFWSSLFIIRPLINFVRNRG